MLMGDTNSARYPQITIIPIPQWARRLLNLVFGWRETPLDSGTRIARHAHEFRAVYFTFGVKFVEVQGRLIELPPAAAVYVPAGVVHGWVSPAGSSGVVGHFHHGHSAHRLEFQA
jgi:quercetin dioxygenase-like cupin family protein